jgi:hypothetical protein
MSERSNQPGPDETDVEKLIGRALRELPLRSAPPTLESRVLGALERHAARPWWQLGFGRWPWGLRVAFGLACVVLAALTIPSSSRVLTELGAFHTLMLPWVDGALVLTGTLRDMTGSITRSVPADWLYVGLGASAALYAGLFGFGVAAYRLLYVQNRSSGVSS